MKGVRDWLRRARIDGNHALKPGEEAVKSAAGAADTDDEPLEESLDDQLSRIRLELDSAELVIRELEGRGGERILRMAVVFLGSMAEGKKVSQFVIKPLLERRKELADLPPASVICSANEELLTGGEVRVLSSPQQVVRSILDGEAVLLVDGAALALAVEVQTEKERAITESSSQTVSKGPKDSFTERIRTNSHLIRTRLRDPALRMEMMHLGKRSHTAVCLVYLKDVASPAVVEDLRRKIQKIDIDAVLGSSYIEEMIEEKRFTVFPTTFSTERPDVIVGNILEGRVAVLVDGTPFALVTPTVFVQFFQASEDYYFRYDIATFVRWIRFLAFLLAMLTPGVFISMLTFHPDLVPTKLLLSIASQRAGVPLPTFLEAVLLEVTFEIIREAGLRMPRTLSTAVTVVGGLVLGETAVEAGLVSPAMVIIVSITAISTFAIPYVTLAVSARLLRFFFMGLGALFGLYGVALGLIVVVAHMNSLSSFGVPYLAPLSPFRASDQKDVFLRLPLWQMNRRPQVAKPEDWRRSDEDGGSNSSRGSEG